MPARKKKTKIKVEEVLEVPVKDSTPKSTTKISSFSQLDAAEKSETASEKETEKVEPKKTEEKPEEHETLHVLSSEEAEPAVVSLANSDDSTVPDNVTSDDVKEWLKDIRPDTTKEIEKKEGFNFRLFFFLILVFTLIGALIGGIFYYKQNIGLSEVVSNVTPEPSSNVSTTPTQTPTPEVKVDLTTYKVNVLNGTNIKGEAAKVKTFLSQKGFKAENITAGNADRANYTETAVSLKANVPPEVFEAVKSSLDVSYGVTKATDVVKDTSTYDIVVIIGKK